MDVSDNGIGENINAGLKRLGLTLREVQILRLLALGKLDRQISIDLTISVKTVNHHVSNIILKLDATNRTHAVAKALVASQAPYRSADSAARPFSRRASDQIGSES